MQTAKNVNSDAAKISILTEPAIKPPLVAHRETLLGDLPPDRHQEYVLVCDDDERIIGLVPTREIDRRLLSTNQFERSRWTAMPIGAMAKFSLSDTRTGNPTAADSEINCCAVREGDSLFGLAVEGDFFLSWKRLESLFTAALSDPLTGLMNRLAYERRLQEEWNRATRTETSIGVVIVDLDDFKSVNDNYGHVVGDELLSRVGRRLEAAMRSYDVVARFGGDEFVALCLGCAPGDIRIPMSRLLEGLSEIEMQVNGKDIHVQASVGAAVRHAKFDTVHPEDLFVAADNCLYHAKKTRNSAWKIEFGCESDGELTNVVWPGASAKTDLVPTTNSADQFDHTF